MRSPSSIPTHRSLVLAQLALCQPIVPLLRRPSCHLVWWGISEHQMLRTLLWPPRIPLWLSRTLLWNVSRKDGPRLALCLLCVWRFQQLENRCVRRHLQQHQCLCTGAESFEATYIVQQTVKQICTGFRSNVLPRATSCATNLHRAVGATFCSTRIHVLIHVL